MIDGESDWYSSGASLYVKRSLKIKAEVVREVATMRDVVLEKPMAFNDLISRVCVV